MISHLVGVFYALDKTATTIDLKIFDSTLRQGIKPGTSRHGANAPPLGYRCWYEYVQVTLSGIKVIRFFS